MTTIVTRAGKGSALTWTEGDSNFTNLNTAKLESVSQDTNPVLGGGLDVNNKTLTRTKNIQADIDGITISNVSGVGLIRAGIGGSDYCTINADIIKTVSLNQTISIQPHGTGDIFLLADTIQVGDLDTQVNITTYGTGNLLLNTNGGTNSGSIQINQGVGGNISITPDTTGDIFLQADTIYVGDSGVTANIFTSGVADMVLGTNSGGTGGSITIGSAASSPITIQPDGTGDVNLNADTVRIGDSASAATLTTNGAGNLTINTNGGTTTGSIIIATGTNGNITLACNGTGVVLATSPIIGSVTSSTNTPAIFARHTVTASASDTNPSINIQKARSDIAFAAMTDEPSVINFQVRDNTSSNRTFFRMIGRYQGTGSNPNFTLRGSADGFTTNLHYMSIGGGVGTFGNASSNYTLTSNTGGALILTANSNTTSGTITVASGADANISLTPNGTGKTVITNAVAYEYVYTAGTTTGTITPNAALGTIQSITLSGSITWNAFGTPLAGQTITMIIKQPASGGPYTLTSTMLFAGASKTLSTAANAVDILSVTYDGTNYWASLSKGYA